MEYQIYEEAYRSFSPMMQDLIRENVRQACETVNFMNMDVDKYEDMYGFVTIRDEAEGLLERELDPDSTGHVRLTDAMKDAIKFCIMEHGRFELSEEGRDKDEEVLWEEGPEVNFNWYDSDEENDEKR